MEIDMKKYDLENLKELYLKKENGLYECDICGEMCEELIDTTEMINGGCGFCCENCIELGDMIWI